MKNDAWRRLPSSYLPQGELLPRYTDVDVWQHLNNGALIAMQGETSQRWQREVLGAESWRQAAPLIAPLAVATDFLAESHYPAALATGCRLLGVDEHGFVLAAALFQRGLCVGLHDTRLVAWADGLPAPLPAALVDTLRAAAARQPALPEAAGAVATLADLPAAGPAPALADLPFRFVLGSRFADSDGHGQTSDASLARYAEQTRVRFLTHVFGSGRMNSATGLMVGHVASRWLRRGGRPPADWQAACGVSRLGERSLAVRGALFDGDTCVAVHDSVMVVIDRESHRSTAMPADWREAMAPYRLPSALPA